MASYDDTATVSGSVVSFSNGADDVPTKSLVVTIPPTLSGVSEVTEKQTGRNLVALNTSPQQAKRDYGITVNTQTADALNITSTGVAYACERLFYSFKKGTYAVKFLATSSDSYTPVVSIYRTNGTGVKFNIQPNTLTTFTLADDTDIDIRLFASGSGDTTIRTVEYTNLQIEVGSTVSTYSQYNSAQYTANLGRTIYGGTTDIVNGTGKDDFASILISETSWTYDSANARFISANLTGMKNVAIRTLHVMAYGYETIDDARPIGNVPDQAIYNANYERKVIIHDSNYTNVSDFLTAKGNISIIYPLATPTDFTFTGQEIPTRLGYNAFWSEQGNTELTYYKDGYGFTSVTVHKETPEGEPVVQTVKFHRIVYEGEVDAVRGTGKVSIGESGTEYDPPETFTFEPISISTDEGENTLFANEGDSSITYRKAVD